MVISDTSYMINGLSLLYWRRNLDKSRHSRDCKESHTTSGEILRLHNCAVADKGSIDDGQCWDYKNGVRLHNCAVADKGSIDEHTRELGKARIMKIAYDFRRYRRTAQLCSC